MLTDQAAELFERYIGQPDGMSFQPSLPPYIQERGCKLFRHSHSQMAWVALVQSTLTDLLAEQKNKSPRSSVKERLKEFLGESASSFLVRLLYLHSSSQPWRGCSLLWVTVYNRGL